MAAKDPSKYEQVLLQSANGERTVDISRGTIMIDYYENIFSPTISAKVQVVNTGDTIKGKDDKLTSVYNGLPLRGGERLRLKIEGNSDDNPGLDFDSDPDRYLYVSSITDVLTSTEGEFFTLNLYSREALTNETTRVGCKYPSSSPISETVKDIIKKYLKSNKLDDDDVEETENPYGFIGNMRKPFTVITWLAAKSVPGTAKGKDATAGYVFFQTKDGYVFKSIDKLITDKPFKKPYFFQEVVQGGKVNNDYKILNYSTNQNQDLMEKLRKGAFCSHTMYMNPVTFEYTPYDKGLFKLEDYAGKAATLGKEVELPPVSQGSEDNLGDIPSRNMTAILDIGTVEKNVNLQPNADPGRIQSQSMMRYGLITTQSLNMMIPSNTNLRAGDIIECQFPRVDREEVKELDEEQSGLYMIKALCHHFDATASYTSLELIKDTFGPQEK